MRLRAAVRAAALGLAMLVGAVAQVSAGLAVVLVREYTGTPDAAARSRGLDAVWLGHDWVDGRRGDRDVPLLADRLRRGGVRDVFVHIGPLTDGGGIDPAGVPRLGWLLGRLHAVAPWVRVQAWLGDVVGPDRLDLADLAVRRQVAATAGRVLGLGLDGIHYDLEPVPDGDPGLLELLAATRVLTRAHGAVLSVAAESLQPLPGMARAAGLVHPQWWSAGYLREVAGRVDQVAVMTYDTAMPSERLYGGYLVRQVRLALAAVPPDVLLLIGTPAYHTATVGHHGSAETVRAAVRATRLALSRSPDRRLVGLALYAEFAATDQDWRDYQDGWVAPR